METLKALILTIIKLQNLVSKGLFFNYTVILQTL